MLRALMTTRFLPLYVILSLPVSQVTAGPIRSHAIETGGVGGGSSGATSGSSMLGGDASSGVNRLLAQVLSELSSPPSTGGVVRATANPVTGRDGPAPADDRGPPAASSPGASGVSLPVRSAGSPASLAQLSNPVVTRLPASRGVDHAGPAEESATDGEHLAGSAGRGVTGSAASSTPGGHAGVSKESGRMSIDRDSTSVLNASNASLRSAGPAGAGPTSVSPGAAIPAAGSSAMSLPNPGAAIPAIAPGPGATTSSGMSTPSPSAATPAIAPGPGATMNSVMPTPNPSAATPAMAPGPGAPSATNGPSVATAPAVGAATSIPGPGAPAVASPASPTPAVGAVMDVSPPSSTGSTGGTSAAGINPGGSMAGGSTAVATPSTSTGTSALTPGSNAPDSSSSTNLSGVRLNAASLIALVPSTTNPLGTVNVSSLTSSGASQLNAALGGPTSLATNPSPPGLAVTPTPLGAATPLPPIQASQTILQSTTSDSTSGSPALDPLPQSIPEPGVLALFVMVSLAAAMRGWVRRLQAGSGRAPI